MELIGWCVLLGVIILMAGWLAASKDEMDRNG
jgi:hypothetical protein